MALFGIVQGGMQIGQSATFAEAFNTARGAAYEIFQVIYRDDGRKKRRALGCVISRIGLLRQRSLNIVARWL